MQYGWGLLLREMKGKRRKEGKWRDREGRGGDAGTTLPPLRAYTAEFGDFSYSRFSQT